MPIEFFEQEEEKDHLDFLPDALEENPRLDGKLFDVFAFKKAKSGKGYMLYTSHFICWFFKKEKPLQQALEALDYYCKTGTGFQFVVKVDKKLKSKFVLGLDSEREAKFVPLENTCYRLAQENDMEDMNLPMKKENPFLLKIKTVPSSLSIDPAKLGDLNPTTVQGEKGRTARQVRSGGSQPSSMGS